MIILHELVLSFNMELERIINNNDTSIMTKIFNIYYLAIEYRELLINNSDITMNDIDIFGYLFLRSIKGLNY